MPGKLIYFVYRLLLGILTPVVLFYAAWRVLRNRRYLQTLPERLGILPPSLRAQRPGAIWIHAVSVGEVALAAALIDRIQQIGPVPVYVSASTFAGYTLAQQRVGRKAAGVFAAPVDYASVIRRVLRRIQPSLLVVFETEIWPNLFREAKRSGCGLILVNGRISDRAFPLYHRWRWFFRHVLRHPDLILAQSETMRDRFVGAGAPPERVSVSGNLKFDATPHAIQESGPIAQWLAKTDGPVLLAASTTADERVDEDKTVLDAFQELKGWRLILAPRKPERFDSVASLLTGRALPFWRRTTGASTQQSILLLDTIGELAALFSSADVVFMGGTLTRTGGHNFLEPSQWGKPVIVGPRLENFQPMAEEFLAARALIPILESTALARAIRNAQTDTETGKRAKEMTRRFEGALEITIDQIARIHSQSLFYPPRSSLSDLVLRPLSALWVAGSRRRSRAELRQRRALGTPVISIGNITAGGTGKTPFVLHLAKRFRERGLEPVVLTRGYGRVSHHQELVIARGADAAVWHVGDEPLLLLRSGHCGLAVGADRFRAGLHAEKELHPDVFLADDAFSHRRLARSVDIVLIDSLDPFGGCDVIPAGRLREPLEALARADLFVITRCEKWSPLAAIESGLREQNQSAPIFRARMVECGWIDTESGNPATVPDLAVAFCGLGNPRSFDQSLQRLGIQPLERLHFPDHHRYTAVELQRIARHARGLHAEAILTTEKDVINFPSDFRSIWGDLRVLVLRIAVEIEQEDEFLRLLHHHENWLQQQVL